MIEKKLDKYLSESLSPDKSRVVKAFRQEFDAVLFDIRVGSVKRDEIR